MKLAGQCGPEKTFCPSEAARAADPENWRGLKEAVRNAVLALRGEDRIQIEQNGQKIIGDQFSGTNRLRLTERQSTLR